MSSLHKLLLQHLGKRELLQLNGNGCFSSALYRCNAQGHSARHIEGCSRWNRAFSQGSVVEASRSRTWPDASASCHDALAGNRIGSHCRSGCHNIGRWFAASASQQNQLLTPYTAAGFHSSAGLSAQPARKPKEASSKEANESSASTSGSKSPEDARREFARAKTGGRYQLPPMMTGANQVKLAPISPNIIAEPYKGELPPLPLVSWVTPKGLKERWRRTIGGVKAMYTLARCRKFVPGFSLPTFKADALKLYEEVCQGIADDDKTLLRQRMTPAAYGTVKAQLKAREEGGWKRVAWALARRPQLHELELVHARLIAANPKDARSSFAQLTVRVRAAHKFTAYDGKRRLVAGDPEREVPVQDVWVLERSFRDEPTSRWRVAGRLSLPPVPPPTEKWWNPMGWFRRMRPQLQAGSRLEAAKLQP